MWTLEKSQKLYFQHNFEENDANGLKVSRGCDVTFRRHIDVKWDDMRL